MLKTKEVKVQQHSFFDYIESDDSALKFLDEKNRRLVRLVSIGVWLGHTESDERECYQIVDPQLRETLENFVYRSDGQLKDFEDVVKELTLINIPARSKKQQLYVKAGELVKEIRDNFLSKCLSNKGNCLDFALTLVLIAQLYYPNQYKVKVIPFKAKIREHPILRFLFKVFPLAADTHYAILIEDNILNSKKIMLPNGLETDLESDRNTLPDIAASFIYRIYKNNPALNEYLKKVISDEGYEGYLQEKDFIVRQTTAALMSAWKAIRLNSRFDLEFKNCEL